MERQEAVHQAFRLRVHPGVASGLLEQEHGDPKGREILAQRQHLAAIQERREGSADRR